MIYTKLIKRLRETSSDFGESDHVSVMMIEAADAIEELQTVVDGLTAQTSMVFEKTEGRTVIKFEPKWIPVTERLPEEDGDYLVWFYDAKCWKVAEFSKHTAKERHVWWFAGIDRTRFVTHWMPLPQPPESDDSLSCGIRKNVKQKESEDE